MRRHLPISLLALLALSRFAFAQSKEPYDNEIGYADSVIYYLQKSQTPKGLDTSIFYKSIDYIWLMDLNPKSIDKIEKTSKKYKLQNKFWVSSKLESSLFDRIANSDSLDWAINYCKKIIDSYDISRDPNEKITAHLALLALRTPLRKKELNSAFDYFTSRLRISLDRKDSTAVSICYFSLGVFYRYTGLIDMAIYNSKKALSYLDKNDLFTNEPISGLYGWMNHNSVLGQLYLEIGEFRTAIAYSLEARHVKLTQLKDLNVSFLNGNIALAKLKLNDLDSINELLDPSIIMATVNKDYPALVRTYEIKGQYFLALNQLDSAEYYFLKCNEAMRVYKLNNISPAGIHTPNYYLAKIRIIQNRVKEARALLEEEIEKIMSMRGEVLKEQKLLIEVYLQLGDSKAADDTFKKYSELQAILREEDRKNRSMSYEVELKIQEAENTIYDLVTEKKIADLTKKYLIGLAALLLIVAAVIFNRFRVTRKQKNIIEKEKQRSEALLLNILPSEVAEELKVKGSADAKQFDSVTVMFTDFKGFTQISERLTPAELVAEIDYLFKAFDNIITRHHIEKIKTIGDAYMCVGGLPVANKTHATDVVEAAMEIQQFMQEHLQQRKSDNKEIFELRIGIHTGQVVAGIVGVKKFAYDIWGDTVNIAARMESSGEAGEINLSGSTYELVKHKFQCIYRGKIQAKHKGEIDMYFVEGVS